ncbi:5-amino-6-(D-ribitylamino)uracil--L-tyrosine 4-hydroxyphenyl transferase CofH [Methanolobus halotolerans]|uniref:5-amino-6-(D-ribitylamino)uracil--L-tyrosine 4-hydroxyphenyl transferase n=1 Tax=Methanolobus halotolerans TaxID=2052935 RepID=A0A4E0QX62_9EURY|nr:5-amino-6-(D-ribitylamino)uracil--L-tyrosine 4-hydroxyphenyl transferase CofH [Methanolobus halotolerans]TGC07044.1 7,8-didemethyl-8-hydroxy-5-deazariboflavin synthase subunit CofH [Methanolobus halotolerans]
MKFTISDDIIENALAGETTKEDALSLLQVHPFELFQLADRLRSESVGDFVTYIINRNINFTNKCIGNCGFCAFKHNSDGYILSTEQILRKVSEANRLGATEVCIQGGLLPDIGLDFYVNIIESIKEEFPHISTHAFSPMEVYHAARQSETSVDDALIQLKKAGLGSMPGTAAEILSDRVREVICPSKLKTNEWVDVVTKAHRTGIPTTATMMYGHIETVEERIDHIMLIRSIQKITGGFTEFVPLPFMPYNNRVGEEMLKSGKYITPGMEDLRIYALARIILNTHVNNIQSSWVKLGKKLSQVALYCGANDLGGTLMEEKISRSAGATNGEFMSAQELEWFIRSSGRQPKQRNTVYSKFFDAAEPGKANIKIA